MMERILPRNEMVQAINKVRSENNQTGRPIIPTIKLLKMYCLQQRYNLADPGVEEAIYDRISFQKFLDIDIVNDQIPDETTICRFRKLLNDNELQKIIFDLINKRLAEKDLMCREGTIVDATIVSAPSSTKNKEKTRDPEMHSTQK